ncbi:DNA helicase [Malassezia cuniculi]|uniref:DNA helicase n=1 Tax=Malassezia cuniculi TaxID=948313 RepID=A0AAF0JBW2_9BASI|nr:DNA helicase [Malassezia cuniculi]
MTGVRAPPAPSVDDVRTWLQRQRKLLERERNTEREQLLERHGLALLGLGVASVRVGQGAKLLVELERPAAFHTSIYFPPHQMRPGDTVELLDNAPKKEGQENKERGVVSRVSDTTITVVIDDSTAKGDDARIDLDLPSSIRLVKLANEVTYDRMDDALKQLEQLESPNDIINCLLGRTPPTWEDVSSFTPPTFLNESLNEPQKSAISFAMRANHLALIHGPPGTGKTTALAELVVHLVAQGEKRILVCGASNLAVDNLLERVVGNPVYRDALQRAGAGATRVGHPARVLQKLSSVTLDSQCAYSPEGELVRDVAREIDDLMSVLSPAKTARAGNKSSRTAPRPKGAERRKMWEQVRELRREYRKREKALSGTVLQRANIVFATCHGAGSRQLEGFEFDYVIIDEVCQALEATCWTPILKLAPHGRVILAGDHLQLPPTVKADPDKPPVAKSNAKTLQPPHTLETTLFDRILHMYGDGCKALLSVQYRMNDEIMGFPNEQLYEGKLVAHSSCAAVRLSDIEGYEQGDDEVWGAPLVFYDTTGAGMYEREGDVDDTSGTLMQSQSKSNENEAAIVGKHIEALVAHGLEVSRIAVLSPYASQVATLSSQLHPVHGHELEIGTVDGMQGREKDAIILSLVRSNDAHEIGFLQDRRRLNVAMTRAKRHLVVVGDADTIAGGRDSGEGRRFLRAWVEHLHSNAVVEMGFE